MGFVPRIDLTPAYADVPPLGLGTNAVESFTGYVVRLGNGFAVPVLVLLPHALNAVIPTAHGTKKWTPSVGQESRISQCLLP